MSYTEKKSFHIHPHPLLFHINWCCNTQAILCSYLDFWSSLLSCFPASRKCMNTWINEWVNLMTQNLKWHLSAFKNLILSSVSFFSSHIKPLSQGHLALFLKWNPTFFLYFSWDKDLTMSTSQHNWTSRPLGPRRVKAVTAMMSTCQKPTIFNYYGDRGHQSTRMDTSSCSVVVLNVGVLKHISCWSSLFP